MDNNIEAIRPNPFGAALPSGQTKKETLPPLPTEVTTPMPYMPSPSMGPPSMGMSPYFTGASPFPAAGGPLPSGFPQTGGPAPSMGFPPTGGPAPQGGFPYGQSPAIQGMGVPPAQQGITSTSPYTGGFGFQSGITPLTPFNQPIPVTTENIMYLNAFLRTMIGRKVTVDFLLGTNTIQDRTGTLLAVGANYIVLNEVETDDILTCDFYSIKFVRVYY